MSCYVMLLALPRDEGKLWCHNLGTHLPPQLVLEGLPLHTLILNAYSLSCTCCGGNQAWKQDTDLMEQQC